MAPGVKPLARELEGEEEGVLIIDDTMEEKPYTDESELIRWHYDHSKGRTVKGINPLSTLYRVGDASIPVAFELVKKTPSGSSTKRRTGGNAKAPGLRTRSTATCSRRARKTESNSATR